jgi:integrase
VRSLIKSQHGAGWSISEQSGRVKITRRFDDGGRSSAMLDLPWASTSASALVGQIESIATRMREAQLSLAEAVRLQAEATATGAATGHLSISAEAVDWQVVIDRFGAHKTNHTGEVKTLTFERMYGPVMRQVMAAMEARPLPRTGRDVLAALRDTYGGEPGSSGRRQRIQYSAQLLRFAVAECGAPFRWLPPDELGAFIGKKLKAKAETTPLTDAQAVRLLEGIPDPRWRLALGLMVCFGLRPVELKYCAPTADGQRLAVTYRKRTSRGSTRPREVSGLDPVGLPGLSLQILAQLAIVGKAPGAVSLPPLGSTDDGTASACDTYLRRRAVWRSLKEEAAAAGESLTVYSCRHGFALRAHEVAELSPRVAAALMGHSLQTHTNHYGRWCDADTLAGAMVKAAARLATAQEQHQQEHAELPA